MERFSWPTLAMACLLLAILVFSLAAAVFMIKKTDVGHFGW